MLTSTSKRSLRVTLSDEKPSAVLCMPLQERDRHSVLGSTFRHCQALVCPSLDTPRRFCYLMTNHHHTFLTGFGWLLSRHTWFYAVRPFNSFAFILFCHRIQPLQQRRTFLIVQCHRGFWLSAVQRKRSWPLLVDLSRAMYVQPSQQSRPDPFQV